MRGKLRFANLFPLVEWAKKHLDNWENIPQEVQKELIFLKENHTRVTTFYLLQTMSLSIQKLLKTNGFCEENNKIIQAFFQKNQQIDCKKSHYYTFLKKPI